MSPMPARDSFESFNYATEPDQRTLNVSHEIIASIITELHLADGNLSSRLQSPHFASSVFSFEPLQQSNLDRISRVSYGSALIRTDEPFETIDLEGGRADSHGLVVRVVDSLMPSKHLLSTLVSKVRNGIANSAAQLFSKPKPKSTISQLQRNVSPSYEQHPPSPAPDDPESPGPNSYPSLAQTALIMFSVYISIFLVALDRTIIGPAIPAITNEFHSLDDVGWYGSAYMLTSCGFILLYGRVYTLFPIKPVFLSGILMFETGSAVCGAANSSLLFIIGRAIAGFGSSGIFTGAILIMLNTVPLHKRPVLQGLFGACFGVASVTGPLLGGAFSGSKATWRWCFYINLPLGAITIVIVLLMLHLEENKPRFETLKDTFKHFDPLGTVLFLPAITCLLLALEWGANEYAWNNPRIIALLTVFAVLFTAFVAWEYFTRNTTATVPARILFQRSVAFGGASQFCVGATMLTVSMYVPLWFQAIKGTSAMKSGIDMIPLVLSVVVGSITSGALVQRLGYYTPCMIVGSCLMAVGAGLITTWEMGTQSKEWIGFQLIFGLGVGYTMQHPNLAVQVVLAKQDVPTGTALLSLCQTLGGAVFVAVGQNVFIKKFTDGLESIHGINPEELANVGATELKNAIPSPLQQRVLEAYNNSLTQGVFFAAMIVACLALPAALSMEWCSVKKNQQPPQNAATEGVEKDEGTVQQRAGADADREHKPERLKTLELGSPAPQVPWRKFYRSSGQLLHRMMLKMNPDLTDD